MATRKPQELEFYTTELCVALPSTAHLASIRLVTSVCQFGRKLLGSSKFGTEIENVSLDCANHFRDSPRPNFSRV